MFNLLNHSSPALEKKCGEVFEEISSQIVSFTRSADKTPVESTHQVRKKLKLFRAFAKLLRHARDKSDYSFVNQTFRDWGRVFSDLRDAHVRQIVLNDFLANETFGAHKPLLSELDVLNNAEISVFEDNLLVQKNEFSNLEEKLHSGADIKAYFSKPIRTIELTEGYHRAFRVSDEAYTNSMNNTDAELIHEWRKRLKDVQYQTELLMGSEPGTPLAAFLTDVSAICDILGIINDFYMLITWIQANKNVLDSGPEIFDLTYEIKTQKNIFLKNAEQNGKLLYEEYQDHISQVIT